MCTKPILFSKIPKSALAVLVFSVLYALSAISPPVAAFIDTYVCFTIRSSAAFLTNLLPFSFFEVFILSFFAIIVALSYRRALLPSPRPLSQIAIAISAVLFVAYTVTLGIATNAVKAPAAREKFTDSELIFAVGHLVDGLNFDFSAEEISAREIYPELLDDIKNYAREELGIIAPIFPKAKESLLGAVLERMGTQAYYCFISGETVYDAQMPPELAIFSIAHETMHFLGVTREDEANFHAMRLCMASKTPAIRYSGTLAAYRYTASALYSQNTESYRSVLETLIEGVRASLKDCNEFSSRYKDSRVRKITEDANGALVRARYINGAGAYSDTARRILTYLLDNSSVTINSTSE